MAIRVANSFFLRLCMYALQAEMTLVCLFICEQVWGKGGEISDYLETCTDAVSEYFSNLLLTPNMVT